MEEHIAAASGHLLVAALRADPEAGNPTVPCDPSLQPAAMEEHIAAASGHLLVAALRADPEAGNLRFPAIPP